MPRKPITIGEGKRQLITIPAMGAMEDEKFLPIGSRRIDRVLPATRFISNSLAIIGVRDIADQAGARAAFDLNARQDIGKPVGVEHTWIFHQQRRARSASASRLTRHLV